MSLDVSFKDADGYLFVRVTGEWIPDDIRQAIQDMANAARERGYNRILLDLYEISAPKTAFDRFVAGKDAARIFTLELKVAAVCLAEVINKFAENTAVNRGANLFITSDMDEALNWLIGS